MLQYTYILNKGPTGTHLKGKKLKQGIDMFHTQARATMLMKYPVIGGLLKVL